MLKFENLDALLEWAEKLEKTHEEIYKDAIGKDQVISILKLSSLKAPDVPVWTHMKGRSSGIVVGYPVWITPEYFGKPWHTSNVVSINEKKQEFTTLNSIYTYKIFLE